MTLKTPESLTWTTFTLTLSQSGGRTFTATYVKHLIEGKAARVVVRIENFQVGSAGNAINVTLPAALTAVASGLDMGGWTYYDSSAGTLYGGRVLGNTTTVLDFWTLAGAGNVLGVVPSIPTGASDVLTFNLSYELA